MKKWVLLFLLVPTLGFSTELSMSEKCIFWGNTIDNAGYFLQNFKNTSKLAGIDPQETESMLMASPSEKVNSDVDQTNTFAIQTVNRMKSAQKLYKLNKCGQYLEPLIQEIDAKK